MTTPVFDLEETDSLKAIIALGFPTFDEFRKNPEKYRIRAEEFLESADGAHVSFKPQLKKVKHRWRGQYECNSLEQLQRICRLEGCKEDQLEAVPTVVSLGGTGSHERFEIITDWYPRDEYRARGGIVAND